jgi:CheY-like chemotaxis protein
MLDVSPLPRKPCILLVEDDDIVALCVNELLEEAGMEVAGPVGRVADAVALIEQQAMPIAAAVLDLDLHGELSYPVADALTRRGIRFIFTTGYPTEKLEAAYHHHPRCEKPFQEQALLGALARIVIAA